jgi:predicted  nucleic acid-binding Zn-ribbon protein
MQATLLMEQLLKVQELQFTQSQDPEKHPELKKLREGIPPQVLSHADRIFARARKAVALIERNVCTGCRMGLPTGTVLAVRQGADIQICGNCGRYLFIAPEPPPAEEVAVKPKRKRAVRKPKAEATA